MITFPAKQHCHSPLVGNFIIVPLRVGGWAGLGNIAAISKITRNMMKFAKWSSMLDCGWNMRWPRLINYHPVIINVWNCSYSINFQTVLHKFRVLALLHITAKLLFIHPGVIVPTPNSIVKYLGSTVCFQLRYMYVCILLRFWVLCSLLAVITFLRVFTFPDNCMCCLSLYCFVLVVLTAWYKHMNEWMRYLMVKFRCTIIF